MLFTVLSSEKAIQVNIAIMRAFIALRRYALTYDALTANLLAHDKDLADINEVLRWLGEEKSSPPR